MAERLYSSSIFVPDQPGTLGLGKMTTLQRDSGYSRRSQDLDRGVGSGLTSHLDEHPNPIDIDQQEYLSRSKFSLKPVFRIAIFGPPGSGKTTLLTDFVNDIEAFFDANQVKVLYCYNSIRPDFERQVYFHRGVPLVSDIISLSRDTENLVVIFDDLLTSFGDLSSEEKSSYSHFITDYSRKLGISSVFVSQEIYHTKADFQRQFIKASTLVVLFGISTDRLSIQRFATQIYAHNRPHFLSSYQSATEGNLGGYLAVPLNQTVSNHPTDTHLCNFLAAPKRTVRPSTVFRERGKYIYESG